VANNDDQIDLCALFAVTVQDIVNCVPEVRECVMHVIGEGGTGKTYTVKNVIMPLLHKFFTTGMCVAECIVSPPNTRATEFAYAIGL